MCEIITFILKGHTTEGCYYQVRCTWHPIIGEACRLYRILWLKERWLCMYGFMLKAYFKDHLASLVGQYLWPMFFNNFQLSAYQGLTTGPWNAVRYTFGYVRLQEHKYFIFRGFGRQIPFLSGFVRGLRCRISFYFCSWGKLSRSMMCWHVLPELIADV